MPGGEQVEVIDLPGTYSLYAKSKDEEVVSEILTNKEGDNYPDRIIVVVDGSNLKRNLLLFSQVKDLGIPVMLALNMGDIADRMGRGLDVEALEEHLGVGLVRINGRTGQGIEEIKQRLVEPTWPASRYFLDVTELAGPDLAKKMGGSNGTAPYLVLHQELLKHDFSPDQAQSIQVKDTTLRYGKINRIVKQIEVVQAPKGLKMYTDKIDSILTHKVWGYVIFIAILFVIFQAIFSWASWPMDMID